MATLLIRLMNCEKEMPQYHTISIAYRYFIVNNGAYVWLWSGDTYSILWYTYDKVEKTQDSDSKKRNWRRWCDMSSVVGWFDKRESSEKAEIPRFSHQNKKHTDRVDDMRQFTSVSVPFVTPFTGINKSSLCQKISYPSQKCGWSEPGNKGEQHLWPQNYSPFDAGQCNAMHRPLSMVFSRGDATRMECETKAMGRQLPRIRVPCSLLFKECTQ